MRETAVTILLVGALGAMLLPLPPVALDVFLTGNLLFAMSLLVIALYLSDTLKLSALPTLLLVTTLFRVALGVATTRSILSTGEAGHAVEAFGSLVMQGSVIVGLVVFSIITLVQFLVIAKGAERVAEVSARFSLDAMPGRQMSIDADVRTGMLDPETARRKRIELQTESRFYGALDGAMKFIKGDAIAGIVIVIVNIIGGLAVGMLRDGLPIELSVQKYTLLSVGEGLISQIPALLNALAAGLVVTRVSREDGSSLADELVSQLGQFNRVKVVAGFASFGLALMPGMPTWILVLAGMGLFLTAGLTSAREAQEIKSKVVAFQPEVTPLLLVAVPIKSPVQGLALSLERARQRVFDEWGILLTPVQVALKEIEKVELRYRGVSVYRTEPNNEAPSQIEESLVRLVRESPDEFIDDIAARRIIDFFESNSPDGVRRSLPEELNFSKVTQVFRMLVSEGIPLKNVDLMLQAFSEFGKRDSHPRTLLIEVRNALRRTICYKLLEDREKLKVVSLDPEVDVSIHESINQDGYVSGEIFDRISLEPDHILVTSRGIRLTVREFLAVRGVKNPVLAHDELVVPFEMIGYVGGENEALAA
jgi:type III secretion protein V